MSEPRTFKPLRIGLVELASPAILAPLAGYSDLPFRLLCRQMGASFAATEVMLDTSVNFSPKLRRQLIQTHETDHPLAGQIMGCRPETMARAARHLVEMGCDVVDLNFACPVRKVLRRRRGGHMMRDPALAVETLQAVLAAVDVPVTLKLRNRFDDGDPDCAAFWQIAEAAFAQPVAAICVHPRSVEQGYVGPADWEFLAEVKRRFPGRTIIGSGDLHTAADGLRMLDATGVDGVAFARGALGNPWIFRDFADLAGGRTPVLPTLCEQRDMMLAHHTLNGETFGRQRAARMMYRFSIRYADLHPTPKIVRHAFVQAGATGFRRVLDEHYPAPDAT